MILLSLKKIAALSIVVSLLGVAVVWGLKTLTAKEVVGSVEAETIYGPIRLTVRLDKNVFRLGERVNVTVTITNISNETIVLGYPSVRQFTDFMVYNISSQMIFWYFRSIGTFPAFDHLILEPSESYGNTQQWPQVREVDVGYIGHQPVDPGTYYVAGRTGPGLYYVGSLDGFVEAPNSPEMITVETPKIEIQIIE